jgi:hypothetical protein
MTVFVVLRIEDDDEARTLVEDFARYPGSPLLTPGLEHEVYVTVESSLSGLDDLKTMRPEPPDPPEHLTGDEDV